MKNLLMIIFVALSVSSLFAQSDKNGNPIFNSIQTGESVKDKFLLISNYYTLKTNIENNKSSVFIAEKPTLDQIENAALSLASEFFILTKESKMVAMVVLTTNPKREFMAIEMSNRKQSTFPCNLVGDISENRANEIIAEQYDPKASIENGILKFNGKTFKIISNKEIENAVWTLIKKEKLDKKTPSEIIMPSKNELKIFILEETKLGGQLDFFTEIKGKENDGVQIEPGVYTTLQSIAIYKWGRACYDLGVNTIDDVHAIYSEFIKKEVSARDKEYLKNGFDKEWEKD